MPQTTSANVRYVVDTRASQFTVQAFAGGLISAVAHSPKIAIRDWTGEIAMVSGMNGDISLNVHVNPASFEVLDELRETERREIHQVMQNEVLETPRYPEIVYESSQVLAKKESEDQYRVTVRGTLNLHGVSNSHEFIAKVSMGVDSARAHGDFTLRQTDYDIRIASVAGGTLKLQDELKFSFYVVARKP
jgi:polyisoprenoid-binding protein YceI